MKGLAYQAVLHLASRVASVLLSFTLFAWIGRILNQEEAVQAYFFSFVLGFSIATSRACLHFAAGIDGSSSASNRIRRLQRGVAMQLWLVAPIGLVVGSSVWFKTQSTALTFLALVIFVLSSVDTDVFRSIVARQPMFAPAFSLGSGLALLGLSFFLPASINGVVLALLIQWLPVCLLNTSMLIRHPGMIHLRRFPVLILAGVLISAGFDGIILNAPFLGLIKLPTQVALDLSLIMRIFVASLPLLPLLLHWINAPDFPKLCIRFGLTVKGGFIVALLGSGAVIGVAFAKLYGYIVHQHIDILSVIQFVFLLAAFSWYFAGARFSGNSVSQWKLLSILTALVIVYYILIMLVSVRASAMVFIALQIIAFYVAGQVLDFMSKPTRSQRQFEK